jgi:hypothetical protein
LRGLFAFWNPKKMLEEWGFAKDVAAQLPIVAMMLAVVLFFVRDGRKDRETAMSDAKRRDDQFTAALNRNSETIAANTATLKDLDKTISLICVQMRTGS